MIICPIFGIAGLFGFGKSVVMLLQGCGNTMPDLSDLVPFHSGQAKNFYLLVLGQEQMYKVNKKKLLSYFD